MGKKRTRSASTSKGERRNVVNGIKDARQQRSALDRGLDKADAWRAGKNPWITIENKKGDTNKPFIKVKANSLWGDPKKINNFGIYGAPKDE